MCGVSGLFSLRRSATLQASKAFVQSMSDSMSHRGPDGAGVWVDEQGRCSLGHRRLSIIETGSGGAQPMMSADGRWVLTFNGEIYNYLELRPKLEAAGVRLKTRSDTETLVEAIALWGMDALQMLDGMFAFAAFNRETGELFLARDPFGEKPLYYTVLAGGELAFASELQALEGLEGFDRSLSEDAVAEVLSFQYIGAPRSIYASTKKLPQGCAAWVRQGEEISVRRYYAWRPHGEPTDRPIADLADELEELLTQSIRRRMISDVPLGAFLSGGVDSSTVCALVRHKLNRPLTSFSIGFDNAPESEHLMARRFAEHLGTDHHDQIVTPDAATFLHEIGGHLDEPNGDSSCLPTYLLSAFAKQFVTVALSGDGGDELFGGYGRYFETLDEAQRHANGALPGWRAGDTYFGSRILVADEGAVSGLLGRTPQGYAEHLHHLRDELNIAGAGLLDAMRRSDLDNYMPGAVLPKVDRMSMQHSLEVRTPFLTRDLARFAENLPASALVSGGRGKLVLREVAYRYLPRELIDLPKRGFGLPMSDWARTSLLQATGDLLGEDSRLRDGFGSAGIDAFLKRQGEPGCFSPYQVWAVAVLESWLRHHPAELSHLRPPAPAPPARGMRGRRIAAGLVIAHAAGADPARSTSARLARKLLQLQHDKGEPLSPKGDGEDFQLSEADDAGEAGFAVLPGRLAKTTLLFTDDDSAFQLSDRACQSLIASGVRRVIAFGTADSPVEVDLTLRPARSALEQKLRVGLLFLERAALASNRPKLQKHFGAISYGYPGPPPILNVGFAPGVAAYPGDELSPRYALFHRTSQAPPIPVSHAQMGEKDRGWYSVYNQGLYFTPRQGLPVEDPLMLVEVTRLTAPLLTMAPARTWMRSTRRVGDAYARRRLLLPEPKQGVRPGDPVVVCTHGLAPGGAERQWVYLAEGLKSAGYAVTVVVYEPITGASAPFASMLEHADIPVLDASQLTVSDHLEAWPKGLDPQVALGSALLPDGELLLRLTTAFRKLAPKAVFAQLDHPNLLAGYAAHLADTPRFVASFRNYNPTNFPYLNIAWYRDAYRALAQSPRVRLTSNFGAAGDDYADWMGAPRSAVTTIPNVVDSALFALPAPSQVANTARELGVVEGDQVVLGVFRLSAEKDPHLFVRVCGQALASRPHVKVFVAGVGPMRNELQAAIDERGLSDRIRLLGGRTDVPVLMSLASVLLHTARLEGMPNVIMEAQAMETAVVATMAGGTAEVVKHGESAILCEVGGEAALLSALNGLLDAPEKARAMGAAGRRHVLAGPGKETLAQRYLELVQDRGVSTPSPGNDRQASRR